MNKFLKISCLILVALFMLPDDADAQRRRKKRKKKKKKAKTEQQSDYRLTDHLWYGAGGTLRFFTDSGPGFTGNRFIVGLTPMVGYKITPWLSAGPRLELLYDSGRYDFGFSEIIKLRTFDYGAGIFGRVKSPFGIYGHFEYIQRSNDDIVYSGGVPQIDANNKFLTERNWEDAAYIGLGYNSQNGFSKWGYEIQLNYNLLAPENQVRLPIDLRFGLTYNF